MMEINLRDRTLDILSMEKDEDDFHFYGYDVESGHYYNFYFSEGKVARVRLHRGRFPNHEYFAAVVGKFDPYAWMTSKVYRLERGWGDEEIQKCWKHFKRLWGGKESPWKEN